MLPARRRCGQIWVRVARRYLHIGLLRADLDRCRDIPAGNVTFPEPFVLFVLPSTTWAPCRSVYR